MTTPTTDCELLEAAARAAGIAIDKDGPWVEGRDDWAHATREDWNPLNDDGDALRLAVKLNLNIEYISEPDGPEVWVSDAWSDTVVVQAEPLGKDPMTATRRAIVRAAAEIGKAMP